MSRDLKGLIELYKIDWAVKFRKFYLEINQFKNSTNDCSPEKLAEFMDTYDRLLDEGDAALSVMKPKTFGWDELRKMLARLRKYKDAYTLFIRDYNAPFTNNQAERDLRPCKTRQKVSGCFRTWDGLVCYAILRSVISTAKKRGENLLAKLSSLFVVVAGEQ
jgi:transposase